ADESFVITAAHVIEQAQGHGAASLLANSRTFAGETPVSASISQQAGGMERGKVTPCDGARRKTICSKQLCQSARGSKWVSGDTHVPTMRPMTAPADARARSLPPPPRREPSLRKSSACRLSASPWRLLPAPTDRFLP